MEFHAGDTVMHWTYGLGQIIRLEERVLSGSGDPLPEDRLERRTHLRALHKDGRAESLCQIIRDLSPTKKPIR